MDNLASDYITLARQLTTNGSYSKSFDLYILAFDKKPQLKTSLEQEFRLVLTKLNEVLTDTGKIEDIFFNFGRAINAFPNNVNLLNNIGKYLYKYGYYTEAWCHFQKALSLDSGFVNAEKNLNSVKNLMVERWHFRMLNDKIRNEAYRAAIKETLIPFRDSVLDVGTGTSLLAIYANECSPVANTGIDGSEVMTKMAENILEDNGNPLIVIINKMSTNLNYMDIGGKRSLLVTEMFDACLFGEHILQSLAHAKEHLLSINAKVLPNKAELFVVGVKCDQLYLKSQLSAKIKKILKISSSNIHVMTYDTYDCEDVYLYKDLKYMTEPQSLLKIDFNDDYDIQEKLNRTEPYKVNLKIKETGEINNVIGWFNIYLTDAITLTTDPTADNRANAWQQAVFCDYIPQTVRENETIDVNFLMIGSRMSLHPNFNCYIERISPETLRFLNDSVYLDMITKCMGIVSVYLGQMTDMTQVNVLDLSPFPFFGLLMLKRGINSMTCWARNENDKEFFGKVFRANKVSLSKITLLMGDDWNQDIFTGEKYHVIFSHVFELCGDVDLRMKDITHHLKIAHLVKGGLFMPSDVVLMGQLVSSPWLDINNRVYDENVSNYKMAHHVNKYQVSQNFCIDLSCLEYTALSEPNVVGTCQSNMRAEVINVPIIKGGECNAILCWFIIEVLEEMGEITTHRSNAFMDGMVFLANPPVHMIQGELANVLRCIDADGSFKFMIDAENT